MALPPRCGSGETAGAPEARDDFPNVLVQERLRHHPIHAVRPHLVDLDLDPPAGHQDNRHGRGRAAFTAFATCHPDMPGIGEVSHHQVEGALPRNWARPGNAVVAPATTSWCCCRRISSNVSPDERLVVDDERRGTSRCPPADRAGPGAHARRRAPGRRGGTSFPRHAGHRDRRLVAADDAVGDGQAEPGALDRLRGEERIEAAGLHLLVHAVPGVGARSITRPASTRGRERERAPARHRVDRVEHEVGEHLAQLGRAARDQGGRGEVLLDVDDRAVRLGLRLPRRARVSSSTSSMIRLRSTSSSTSSMRTRVNSWMRRTVCAPSCAVCSMSSSERIGSGSSARASRSCVRPRIAASMLLKSCATPEAISPRARSFATGRAVPGCVGAPPGRASPRPRGPVPLRRAARSGSPPPPATSACRRGLVRVVQRAAVAATDRQHAQQPVTQHDRESAERASPMAKQDVARHDLSVPFHLNVEPRLAPLGHHPHAALAEQQTVGRLGPDLRRPVEGPSEQDALRLVGQPDGRQRRVAEHPGGTGDLVQDVLQPERRGHRPIHAIQALEPLDVSARRVVEPSVLDGDRRERSERGQGLHLAGGRLVSLPPIRRQAAERRALRQDRNRQDGPVALVLDQSAHRGNPGRSPPRECRGSRRDGARPPTVPRSRRQGARPSPA